MKILGVSSYNEKLKINPMSLDDFNEYECGLNVTSVFKPDMLESLNIVQIRAGKHLMVITKNTNIVRKPSGSITFNIMYNHWKLFNIDMLITVYNGEAGYVGMLNYDDNGNNVFANEYDIVKIWQAPENVQFRNSDVFDDSGFVDIIKNHGYKLIYKNENN